MPITIFVEEGKLKVKNPEDYEALRKTYYGEKGKGEIILIPEEAMYLMEVRNAVCVEKENLPFSEIVKRYGKEKIFARYMTYKDWRERGLIIRPYKKEGKFDKNPTVKYPSKEVVYPKVKAEAIFFKEDKMGLIEDENIGKELYYNYWIGQYGSYKAEGRGKFLKLDKFETYFLYKNCNLKIANMSDKEFEELLYEDKDFEALYEIYEDWRMNGFIVKTGFKFGTHFRIYFPGALPGKGKEWTHSKHVLHVFPRNKRMIIAEWARAIRVAHGVRKTFILAIPGKKTKAEGLISFLLYHRKNNTIETPEKDTPSFALVSLSEEEMIGGNELASAIEEAKEIGLDIILGIVDRETSVTYYRVKRIDLPNSKYEYYEIEWIQP
ncbi:MAG: tRNA-intron lyase [Candidatus Micrarchaeota archaeon]|nr:tRNA-intron lyase [Candidatus Micrarchaeota archaeon]